jgi:translocation and assembly module TamB
VLKLEQLDLALGRNTVAASGEWADTLDFQLRLDAPDLDRAWPDLAGRMELEARLTGDPDRPRLRARGTGSGLRFADLALAQLELDANAGLDQGAPTAIDLRLAGLEPADVSTWSACIWTPPAASTHTA